LECRRLNQHAVLAVELGAVVLCPMQRSTGDSRGYAVVVVEPLACLARRVGPSLRRDRACRHAVTGGEARTEAEVARRDRFDAHAAAVVAVVVFGMLALVVPDLWPAWLALA
jgi:hypothetical protein